MTATITKRADELKPGDVFGSHIVIATKLSATFPDEINVLRAKYCAADAGIKHEWHAYSRDYSINVTAHALSPAQQHAEELLKMVRNAENILSNWQDMTASEFQHARNVWAKEAKPLLAKIDPPAPPTLEEALAAIIDMRAYDLPRASMTRADDILDRARRAGVLKE